MKRFAILVLAAAFALSACSTAGQRGAGPGRVTGSKLIAQYVSALNRRDLLALTLYTTPDVEWYSIVDGERILEVSGREGLANALKVFLDRYEAVKWTIEASQTVNDRVAVSERTEWREAGRTEVRNSMGVYELYDGRIRRITYFLDGG